MIVSVVQLFCGWVLVTLPWGLGYFLAHHTGLVLLADLLKVRIDWAPPPPSLTHWIEAFVLGIAAPFQVGRFAARCCPGREVAAWVIVLLIWPLMAIFVPLAQATSGPRFVPASSRFHWQLVQKRGAVDPSHVSARW